MTRSARVIIASTRAANGVYDDRTGPVIVAWLTARGYDVTAPHVVADGLAVTRALWTALGEKVVAETKATEGETKSAASETKAIR